MSNHQLDAVCSHHRSLGVSGPGTSVVRSTVDADAANPHRAGVNQDIWSSTGRLVTGIMPPENTSWLMIATTRSGMICSLDFASDDSSRPRFAEATQVAAIVTNNSRAGLPRATAPCVPDPLPQITIAVTIADWASAKMV